MLAVAVAYAGEMPLRARTVLMASGLVDETPGMPAIEEGVRAGWLRRFSLTVGACGRRIAGLLISVCGLCALLVLLGARRLGLLGFLFAGSCGGVAWIMAHGFLECSKITRQAPQLDTFRLANRARARQAPE